ncbi:MAG: tRNA (guanosine(37)-N1)-methyltransferase TrmD, partial [Deltaproteobacteria bacterium]
MTKPTFHFITLFPETIQVWMTTSILGRALKAELFDLKIYQLRDFSEDKHLSVDDAAYGGGGGMVL